MPSVILRFVGNIWSTYSTVPDDRELSLGALPDAVQGQTLRWRGGLVGNGQHRRPFTSIYQKINTYF
jgi:hypothetical protein